MIEIDIPYPIIYCVYTYSQTLIATVIAAITLELSYLSVQSPLYPLMILSQSMEISHFLTSMALKTRPRPVMSACPEYH